MEAVVVLSVALALLVLFAARKESATGSLRIAVPLLGTLPIAGLFLRPSEERAHPPLVRDEEPSSSECKGCHEREYATWRATYHRTMTTRPSAHDFPATLPTRLPDGSELVRSGRDGISVRREQGEHPMALVTGSHNYRAFWTVHDGRTLELEPYVFLLREKTFVLRAHAFLQPDGAADRKPAWSSNCIQCHAVGGRAARAGELAEVSELGVACGACHGASRRHLDAMRSPVARYMAQRRTGGLQDVVLPTRLPSERSSAICGQCHSLSLPVDEESFFGTRSPFRPGERFELGRRLLTVETLSNVALSDERGSLFFSDGTVRIAGREYNGLTQSRCYVDGEGERKLACTSCHSLHDSAPNDQLRRDRSTDDTCSSCHSGYSTVKHTHHASGSPGVSCVECHMPRTSYALFSAIRSHRITKPAARGDAPSACVLCHLDKSEEWAARELDGWSGSAPRSQSGALDRENARALPYGPLALLSADAGVRAIVADVLGGSAYPWKEPLLAELLVDDYAAVRRIAARALAREGTPVVVDPEGPQEVRDAVRREIQNAWDRDPLRRGPPPFFRTDGTLDRDKVDEALAGRDRRAVTLAE